MSKAVSQLLLLALVFATSLSVCALEFDASEFDSISHFRAHSMHIAEEQNHPFARHSQQDDDGFIWITSESVVQRFNGFDTQLFELPFIDEKARGTSPFLYNDREGQFWVGQAGLFYFDRLEQDFVSVEQTQAFHIDSIIEDRNGYLWFAGNGFGIHQFDKANQQVRASYKNANAQAIKDVHSLSYDAQAHVIWLVAASGIYRFDIQSAQFTSIETELDEIFESFLIRDAALDTLNKTFWVGTFKGLLKVDTQSFTSRLYTVEDANNTLPSNHATTAFIDSNNNTWFGFEKAGICTYQINKDAFLCLQAAFNEKGRIPFATVEDINEDQHGSLWLSMNSYGLTRVSPDLEKFADIRFLYPDGLPAFFPYTFDGEISTEGQLWFATDGGGIAIFDLETKSFDVLKHDPGNPNSLGADSVITLSQDEFGNIWAGMWAGGMARIDPKTKDVRVFQEDPNAKPGESLGGNNIFVIEADKNGGLWIASWGNGVQYYDFETKRFTNYFSKARGGDSDLFNLGITDMVLSDEYLFIVGRFGLERLHIASGKVELVLDDDFGGMSHVIMGINNDLWVASASGLLNVQLGNSDYRLYTEGDGLADNDVHFLEIDDKGRVWAATNDGLSVFNAVEQSFTNFFEQDGLVSNSGSTHGEFTAVNGQFFVPSPQGITIIDPLDLPKNEVKPAVYIRQVEAIETDASTAMRLDYSGLLTQTDLQEIPFNNNSIKIDFNALAFVFPEYIRYKYRLSGWQSEFVELSAQQRSVSFTNLPAGEYEFEVFASNADGLWSEMGASFSFTVLSPWWLTKWFIALALLLMSSFIYGVFRWRIAANKRVQKALKAQVAEKTLQLQNYAADLKQSSDSLAHLNSELEGRVLQRTQQLEKQIAERRDAELQLHHMAFHDSLTDLPNRESITQLIDEFIQRAQLQPDFVFSVMFLDGDRFKQINDTLGHSFGDSLLIACAKRLDDLLGTCQHVARLGGDEFTVVTENLSEGEVHKLAGKIVEAFEEPFYIEQAMVYFNVSIGVVICDQRYQNVPTVLKNADIAMYHAKASGRSVYKVFDERMQAQATQHIELEQGLRDAVSKQEFELVYQPIFTIEDNALSGFEALLRWHHPEKGLISPAQFIPIAEETGLIWDIGAWVLCEACKQLQQWHQQHEDLKPTVAINLSSNQLRNTHFLALLDSTIAEFNIDSRYLKLELTESLLIENNHQLETLYSSLKKRQIDLAIDDFGTGYSSLAYLNNIPVQFLKIDRSFVAAIDNNTNNLLDHSALTILEAIVSLGKGLGKQIIAEGIETPLQLEHLKNIACDMGQGYFLARPLSKKDADTLLLEHANLKRDKS